MSKKCKTKKNSPYERGMINIAVVTLLIVALVAVVVVVLLVVSIDWRA